MWCFSVFGGEGALAVAVFGLALYGLCRADKHFRARPSSRPIKGTHPVTSVASEKSTRNILICFFATCSITSRSGRSGHALVCKEGRTANGQAWRGLRAYSYNSEEAKKSKCKCKGSGERPRCCCWSLLRTLMFWVEALIEAAAASPPLQPRRSCAA